MRTDPFEAPEAAVEGDLILGPQLFQQHQRLVHAGRALAVRDPEVVELLRPVAQAGAEDEPSFGHDVERGDLLRQQHRVVQRRDHDLGDQPHPRANLGRQAREQRHRLQPAQVAVQEVLPDGDVGEAVALGGLRHADDVLELLGGRHRARYVAQ